MLDSHGAVVIDTSTNQSSTSRYGQYKVPATAVGTYTAQVGDYYSNSAGGTYAVELIKVPGSLAADSNGDGGAIASGQTKTGTMNRNGDIDAYTFTAAAGDTFEVTLGDTTPASSTSVYHPALQVIDPNGNVVIDNYTNQSGTSEYGQYRVPATAVGTYTIRAADYYGNSSALGSTYALELVKAPGSLAADSDGNGGAIVSGQTKTGTINRNGDIDAYAFTAAAGDTFELSLGDTTPASSTSVFHPSLQVIDPNGNIVVDTQTNQSGTSVYGQYRVPATAVGTYTIRVLDYYGNSKGGTYALELIKAPGSLTGDSDGNGGAIASGQTKTGTMNRNGDLDAYTFTAAAGDFFELTLGDTTPATSTSVYHPALQVIDPNGNVVIDNYTNQSGTSEYGQYKVPATAAGTYTVRASDYYGNSTGGTYALELIKVPAALATDSNGDGGAIAVGTPRTGKINRNGDLDAFTFSASTGDVFTLTLADVTPASSTSVVHPSLQVIDPNGNLVIDRNTNQSGTSVAGQYTVPATAAGIYTVRAGDYYGNSSGGTYSLQLTGTVHSVTSIKVTPPASQAATAGVAKSFTLGSFTASNTTSPYTVTINWGDGSAKTILTLAAAGTIPAQTHTYANSGDKTASIVITDSRSHTSNTASFAVAVAAGTSNTASIAGTVYNDLDSDGIRDSGEAGLAGVVVYNDANNNSAKDTGEAAATTDASGNYKISSLPAGTYKLRQVLPSGFAQVTPTSNLGISVTLAAGQAATGKTFGDHSTASATGTISGRVFNDADSDGTFDPAELGLGLWQVYADANNNGKLDSGEKSATTDADGNWALTGLTAATYVVRVVQRTGTATTTPNGGKLTLTLAGGQTLANNLFGEKRIA